MDKLGAFLRESAGRRFELGQWDCGLWLADWYVVATGKPDPAVQLRGAGKINAGHAIRTIVKRLKLERTHTPARGDVGAIAVARSAPVVGGIFTGTHWMMLSIGRGIAGISPDRIRAVAWRVDASR